MKVLPADEKTRITEMRAARRDEARRERVREELAHTGHIGRLVDRIVFFALGAGLVALVAVVAWIFASRHLESRVRYRPETREAFLELSRAAASIEEQHNAALKQLDLDLLRNYALIENMQDSTPLFDELKRARTVLKYSREKARGLFMDLWQKFPPESVNERLDAQRIYGELMAVLDASEERIENDTCVLQLLVSNRGKWHVHHGKIEFSEEALRQNFDFYQHDTDGSTARWRKDFGSVADGELRVENGELRMKDASAGRGVLDSPRGESR